MYVDTDHHLDTHISPTPMTESPSYGYQIRRCSSSSPLYSKNFAARPSMSRRSIPHMRLPLPAVLNGERSQGGSNRSRPNSPRPSVAVMKKLMPLRLSSVPSVTENEVKVHADSNWPLSTAQSTPARDEHDSDSTSLITDRSSLSTAQSTDSFRDIPYCMKPGLPSPSRVYFTKEDGCFQCLPPDSPCRVPRVVADYQTLDGEDYFTDCAEELDHECDDYDGCERSRVTSYDSSRASSLSIQCLGENLAAEEPSWFGNSMFDETRSESPASCDEHSDTTSILSFDSGTSRWTPPPQHNEIFEHATALSPAKAHVVHVRKSSITTFPPRQSSLLPETPEFFATSFFHQLSHQFNHTTPPDSPDDTVTLTENEDCDSTPRASHLPATNPLPSLHLDLAFSSPPASPARTVHLCPSLNSLRLSPCFSSGSSTTSSASASSSPLTTTGRSILTAIINAIDGFPSTMLLPSTPCITQLRNLQHRGILTPSFSSASLSSLDTPEPAKESRARRKSKTTALFAPLRSASSSSASTSTSSSTSTTSSYASANTSASSPPLPEPNLQPLTRIFPHTTPFMHGALYAHLLAYNFAVDTQCALDGSAARRMPSKAARVMGVEQSEEDMTAVVDGIRDVVMRLVQGMGGECTGGLVVALGEVVRLCEV